MPSLTAASRIRPLALVCILATASLLPALDYGFGPGDETLIARREIHRGIIDHTARDPDRYRWLAAHIVEPPVRLLSTVMPRDQAFDRVSTAFYFAAIAGLLWSLFACLRLWFTDDAALIATLVAACTLRITMRQHDYAPYSFLEPIFVALSILAIHAGRYAWLGALIALASFNRETAVFLVLLHLVTSDWSRAAWIRTFVYAAIWAAVFVAVRIASGEGDRYWSIDLILRTNLSQPRLALANITMLLGAFWLFAVMGWSRAPGLVRRSALIIPAYLVTIAIWGIWWEVRLLMPLYPILLALALSYLTERPEWPAWVLAGIFATAVAVNAFDYSVLVPQQPLRYEMHQAIVDGTAPAPQRFRVLVPWLLDPMISVARSFAEPDRAFRRVYTAFHFAALTALLGSVYAYARLWFSRERATIGALIIGSTLHLVLRMGEYWDFSPIPDRTWFAPWSLVEPVFIAAGLILLQRGQIRIAAIVAAVAAFNSEASIVIALASLLLGRSALIVSATWVVTTIAVRAAIGGFEWPALTLQDNLAHVPSAAINLFLFLGLTALLAIAGFRQAPRPARLAMIAATPLLLAVALFGFCWDVRLLTPLYPLVAPLVLSAALEVPPSVTHG